MTNGVCLNTELRLQWRETDNWQLRRQEKKKKIGEGLFYIQMALKVIKYPGKNSRQTNFVIQNIFKFLIFREGVEVATELKSQMDELRRREEEVTMYITVIQKIASITNLPIPL